MPAYNVVGVLEGSDPKLKIEAIVIGAHYDHLGRGGEGSLAPREGEVHHGADDNASGTAGVLELARLFSSQKPSLDARSSSQLSVERKKDCLVQTTTSITRWSR